MDQASKRKIKEALEERMIRLADQMAEEKDVRRALMLANSLQSLIEYVNEEEDLRKQTKKTLDKQLQLLSERMDSEFDATKLAALATSAANIAKALEVYR